jgi:antitoxin CptB
MSLIDGDGVAAMPPRRRRCVQPRTRLRNLSAAKPRLLPVTNDNVNSGNVTNDNVPVSLDFRRRRAILRSSYRGTKEMDIVLGRYAAAMLPELDEANLTRFERFLALPDPDLQRWFFEPETVAGLEFADLIADVRRFHGLPESPSQS